VGLDISNKGCWKERLDNTGQSVFNQAPFEEIVSDVLGLMRSLRTLEERKEKKRGCD
jgi:hypothetical protein